MKKTGKVTLLEPLRDNFKDKDSFESFKEAFREEQLNVLKAIRDAKDNEYPFRKRGLSRLNVLARIVSSNSCMQRKICPELQECILKDLKNIRTMDGYTDEGGTFQQTQYKMDLAFSKYTNDFPIGPLFHVTFKFHLPVRNRYKLEKVAGLQKDLSNLLENMGYPHFITAEYSPEVRREKTARGSRRIFRSHPHFHVIIPAISITEMSKRRIRHVSQKFNILTDLWRSTGTDMSCNTITADEAFESRRRIKDWVDMTFDTHYTFNIQLDREKLEKKWGTLCNDYDYEAYTTQDPCDSSKRKVHIDITDWADDHGDIKQSEDISKTMLTYFEKGPYDKFRYRGDDVRIMALNRKIVVYRKSGTIEPISPSEAFDHYRNCKLSLPRRYSSLQLYRYRFKRLRSFMCKDISAHWIFGYLRKKIARVEDCFQNSTNPN